jgi:formylglycine-generating enzyme required for sulfatase activity
MSGNVSEWTSSKYSPAAGARTYKGGSATRPNWATRCASRFSASPGARKADLGFRCCAKPK